jgi:pilus assembly protein CpaE
MSIYILTSDIDIQKSDSVAKILRGEIPDLIKISSLAEIIDEPSNLESSYLLLVAASWANESIDKVIEEASQETDHLFRILISDMISADDYKRLVRTGSADWVSTKAIAFEVLDIISRHRSMSNSRASERQDPIVISLVPSAGGVGNAFLAVEIGVWLRSSKLNRNRKICVVDLDLQSSHVCDYLDIEPRLQIQEISTDPERLDDQLFDIFVSRHSTGLHVFAAPRTKFDICDLNILALDSLFNMISRRYDLIIIDLPSMWFSWTSQIIARSDAIIVTGLNTVPGLRQIVETVEAVRNSRPLSPQMAIVVNRYESNLLGRVARRHHVEKVLGNEKVFYIRNDPAVAQGINAGTPIVLARTNRQISKEIAKISVFFAEASGLNPTSVALGLQRR